MRTNLSNRRRRTGDDSLRVAATRHRQARSRDDSGISKTNLERLTVKVSDTCIVSGLSRSTIYRLAQRGQIKMVKAGGRSLIVMESLREYLANLPSA